MQMLKDYYGILKAKPSSSQFRIANNYYKLMKEYLRGNDEIDKENVVKACEAYIVIGDERIRKYYDILYESSFSNKVKLNEYTAIKYSDIINHYANEGNVIAERILEDPANEKLSVFTSSLLANFFKRGLWSGSLMEIKFFIAGVILFIYQSLSFDVIVLIGALTMTVLGVIFILSNLRLFAISYTQKIVEDIKKQICAID